MGIYINGNIGGIYYNGNIKTAYVGSDKVFGETIPPVVGYEGRYVAQTTDGFYLQIFKPKSDISIWTVNTFDTCSNTTSENGLLIFEGDGSDDNAKWNVFASTANNHQSAIVGGLIDGNQVYYHTWSFTEQAVMSKDKTYAIQINFSKYSWSMTQYDYVGTYQNGVAKNGSMISVNSWLANLSALRDAEIGTQLSSIGGTAITILPNKNVAYTEINGTHILDL